LLPKVKGQIPLKWTVSSQINKNPSQKQISPRNSDKPPTSALISLLWNIVSEKRNSHA